MVRILHALLCVTLLLTFSTQPSHAQSNKASQFTLVIDAGHGGKDPGAIGRGGNREKNINLNVAKSFGNLVQNKYPEIKIVYTRTKDVFIPLKQRANIANKAKADLFISIHTNASKNSSARGCETFTLGSGSNAEALAAAKYENEVILQEENFETTYEGFDPRSTESYIMFELIRGHDMEKSISCAEHIQNRMVSFSKLSNRGVSSAGFLVLHQTAMPSILVELGFISNSAEEKFLSSSAGQEKLARGIFDGFCKYYEEYKKTKINSSGTSPEKKSEPAKAPRSQKSEQPSKKAGKPAVAPAKAPQNTAPANSSVKQQSSSGDNSVPVFKVQIFTSGSKLKSDDKRLKGEKADYYSDGKLYKYTCGESTDYNEIEALCKRLSKKFKDAFIVAFKDGKRVDINKIIDKK